jgi:hypothetical protein
MNPVNFVDPMGKKLYIGGDKAKVLGWIIDILGNSGSLYSIGYYDVSPLDEDVFLDLLSEIESGIAEGRIIEGLVGTDEIQFSNKPSFDINRNAGAWLINELINSNKIYLLGAGDHYPSLQSLLTPFGSSSGVGSLINLDRQIDQRLVRIGRTKTQSELPPTGVDSVVWFSNDIINNVSQGNVVYFDVLNPNRTQQLSPNDFYLIVFHELLESYMEVEYGLQYLDNDSCLNIFGRKIGSHNYSIFLERNYLRIQRNLPPSFSAGIIRRN